MLKKSHRGLQSPTIQELFKGATKTYGNSFMRINWNDSTLSKAQFVVITPKKFHQSAVLRNKMRRRVYRLLKKHFSDWTRRVRVAILIKSPALRCTEQEFEDHFLSTMSSVGLLTSKKV